MLADFCGTTALPDNGVIDRLAGFFFPDNSGFTLVRNTDSCNLIGTDIGFRQHFYQRGALGGPDFHWVVFYPTWFWVDLLKFALRHANDIGIVIHYDRAGAGGALVERNDIFFFGHGMCPVVRLQRSFLLCGRSRFLLLFHTGVAR